MRGNQRPSVLRQESIIILKSSQKMKIRENKNTVRTSDNLSRKPSYSRVVRRNTQRI